MADSNWERLQTLFEQAVVLPEKEREAFLQSACGSDTGLRQELESLLNADAFNSGHSDYPGSINVLGAAADLDASLIGTTIGAWRLLERIGVGGMGSVFLAERADQRYQQRVAFKVVKKGMDTESVIQRFRRERQILARLNHPNIARILDGGVTDDGRPYFVMEYIDGLPITDYCDSNCLGLEDRLSLFETACDAVHYAHQSLVVHRDLKPSNIIVTADGELKLLDFGIAKLLGDSDDEHLTKTGLQIHTPAYAAPEQLLNDAVTTATDVYALGVILYELLSGRRPFEVRRTAGELKQLVLAADPAKPSAAVTQIPADADGRGADTKTIEQLSALRGARVERLRRMLEGDLDTICLMALHREPEHRYRSANQMAADIRRHLTGKPVIARPDSFSYRMGKFVRRHRAGVITTVVVAGVFIGMSVFYTLRVAEQRDLALNEQRKANEVVDFVTGLFEVADPSESRGKEISARELVDAGAVRIQNELADRPGIQSTMKRVLGEVYYSLGAHQQADKLITDALQQQQALYGDASLEVATSKIALGLIYQDRGDPEAADELYRQGLATRRLLLGDENFEVMEALSVRAFLEETTGNYPEAEALHAEVLQMGQRLYAGDHGNLAEAMTKLAGLFRILDRPDEAEPLLRDALAMQARVYGGAHPESDDTKRQLAGLLRDSRRFEESERLYKEVIESRTRMLGPKHLEVAHSWNSYSQLLAAMEEFDRAIAANQKFIDITEMAYDGPHPSLGAAYNNLAVMMKDQRDYEGAIKNYQLSIDMQDAVELPATHPHRSFPTSGMAEVFLRQQRFEEAESLLRTALKIRIDNFPEEHRLISELKSSLGASLTGLQQYAEAEVLLLDAYRRFFDSRGAEDGDTRSAARRLAELYDRTGDADSAATYRSVAEAAE